MKRLDQTHYVTFTPSGAAARKWIKELGLLNLEEISLKNGITLTQELKEYIIINPQSIQGKKYSI